jgi:hypothetical protein
MNVIAKAALTEGFRFMFGYVEGMVEARYGNRSVPDNVLNAIAPVLSEMAMAAMNDDFIDPETGRLSKLIRIQYESRITQALADTGLLQEF